MTENFFLIGHPIAHSKSPAMYNAFYKELGLDWRYELMDCETEAQAKDFVVAKDYLAINVTMPYKQVAFDNANMKASTAKLSGGASMLVHKKGSLIAYNMDGEGCISFLESEGVNFDDASVMVCGTGPTALAITHAAALAGAQELTLLSRNEARAQAALNKYAKQLDTLASAVGGLPAMHEGWRTFKEAFGEVMFVAQSYEDASEDIAHADIIIDATSLGMNEGDPAPFDTALLHEGQVVCDVVYGHGTTAFIAGAQQAGCVAYDGLGMLVSQAASSAIIQCEVNGIDLSLTHNDIFSIMYSAIM